MIKHDLLVSAKLHQIVLVLTSVNFSVFTLIQQEKLMGWHPSGVKRTRIRVITVNFSDFLIKGQEIKFKLAGNSRYPSSN